MKRTAISLLFAGSILLAGPAQNANAKSAPSTDLIVTHAYVA
jgi:hypothetical protein